MYQDHKQIHMDARGKPACDVQRPLGRTCAAGHKTPGWGSDCETCLLEAPLTAIRADVECRDCIRNMLTGQWYWKQADKARQTGTYCGCDPTKQTLHKIHYITDTFTCGHPADKTNQATPSWDGIVRDHVTGYGPHAMHGTTDITKVTCRACLKHIGRQLGVAWPTRNKYEANAAWTDRNRQETNKAWQTLDRKLAAVGRQNNTVKAA